MSNGIEQRNDAALYWEAQLNSTIMIKNHQPCLPLRQSSAYAFQCLRNHHEISSTLLVTKGLLENINGFLQGYRSLVLASSRHAGSQQFVC